MKSNPFQMQLVPDDTDIINLNYVARFLQTVVKIVKRKNDCGMIHSHEYRHDHTHNDRDALDFGISCRERGCT